MILYKISMTYNNKLYDIHINKKYFFFEYACIYIKKKKFMNPKDFYEIFLDRMLLCRKAAEVLGCTFRLEVEEILDVEV